MCKPVYFYTRVSVSPSEETNAAAGADELSFQTENQVSVLWLGEAGVCVCVSRLSCDDLNRGIVKQETAD